MYSSLGTFLSFTDLCYFELPVTMLYVMLIAAVLACIYSPCPIGIALVKE